jgi:hypothetical protein
LIRSLLKIAASLVLLSAAVFLATSSSDAHHPLLVGFAAAIIAIPGMLSLYQGIDTLFTKSLEEVRNQTKRTLQTSINRIYRDGSYPGDVTKLSFHVWSVPRWYRRVVPYSVRRKVKKDGRRMPERLRPRLQRLATFRWEHLAPSNIKLRKGVGVVGRCIDLNQRDKTILVRFDSRAFQTALRQGPEHWSQQTINITQNLSFESAEELSTKYGQVAALVLCDVSGEAIGCITIELPPGAPVSLRRKSGHDLMQTLYLTRENVETVLTAKSVYEDRK